MTNLERVEALAGASCGDDQIALLGVLATIQVLMEENTQKRAEIASLKAEIESLSKQVKQLTRAPLRTPSPEYYPRRPR